MQLDVLTYLVDDDDQPIRLARTRYALCLRGRFAIPRLAAKTARLAHMLVEVSSGHPRVFVDERYPRVRFDDRGHATHDDDFLELCTAAVGLRVPRHDIAPALPVLLRRPRVTDRSWKPAAALRRRLIAGIFRDPSGLHDRAA